MNTKILAAVCAFSSLFGIEDDLREILPIVHGIDSESALYAAPYLPDEPVILEAGTCDGTDTRMFKKIWRKATVYGFEPSPDSYARTVKNIRKITGIHVFPYGLSDQEGEVTFYVSHLNAGCSSMLKDNFDNVMPPTSSDGDHYQDEAITVKTITVNTWGKKHHIDHIDYIWLDTEGMELPILRSATDYLDSVRVISTEVNFKEFREGMTQFSDLYAFLTEHGFTLKYFYGNPTCQGVAMFINNKLIGKPLNLKNRHRFPEPKKTS